MFNDENTKMVVALRTGRSALGWSQQELADALGIAKSTVARVETLEVRLKADFLYKALKIFKEHGILIDLSQDDLPITLTNSLFLYAQNRLLDENMRRVDRKKNKPEESVNEK